MCWVNFVPPHQRCQRDMMIQKWKAIYFWILSCTLGHIMFRGDDTTNSQHQTRKVFLASDHWLSFDLYLFQGRIWAHCEEFKEPQTTGEIRSSSCANSDVSILEILDCVMNISILSHGMVRFKRIQVTCAIQLPLHTAVTYCLEGRFWWHVTQTKLR